MKFGPEYKFWCVIDPTPASELVDILFETSFSAVARGVVAGYEHRNPMFYTDRKAAESAAKAKLIHRNLQVSP